MDVEQQFEWEELRAKVISSFRQCGHINTAKHCPHVQFLVFPLFRDVFAVDIVETPGKFGAFMTTWRQAVDIHAFESGVERQTYSSPFVPTIESKRIGIPVRELGCLVDQIASTDIGLCRARSRFSLDGTLYELCCGTLFAGVRLRWHDDLPSEWSALSLIVDKFREMLKMAGVSAT